MIYVAAFLLWLPCNTLTLLFTKRSVYPLQTHPPHNFPCFKACLVRRAGVHFTFGPRVLNTIGVGAGAILLPVDMCVVWCPWLGVKLWRCPFRCFML